MKKILGLDLGTNSIGWALITTENNAPKEILGMGSRIIPLSPDDANEFSTGNAISKNSKRTSKRTARKGYDRYQQRRQNLTLVLRALNMLPDEHLIKLPILELWQLRANAATAGHKLTLPEIGRVLYHLNQKRGYKHAKSDEGQDTKQREYVANVNARYAKIKELNQTIGQYFAEQIKLSEVITGKGTFYTYRTKEQVFPRAAYMAEFDQIMECQKVFYPNVLTDKIIDQIRNEIIYYQRKLKSCKHLVSLCEFEKRAYTNKDGKIVYDGPKVAPRTSPLFQVCKIWESVNNLTLKNRRNDVLYISPEQRQSLFNFLDNHEKMTLTDMYKILNISKADGWWGGKAIGKGLQGNTTKMQLKKALNNLGEDTLNHLLQFNLSTINSSQVDIETGEVLKVIDANLEKEPLYDLWHTVYSIQEKEVLQDVLNKKFGITDIETIDALYKLDFIKPGYGNKSSKFIRKILPYLQEGLMYSDACEYVGINHSNSLTKEQNEARELLDKLPQIQKNELRQPVVEKILNQMVNVVNAIIDKHGPIDEIRVELARELKQSKDERNETDKRMRKNQRDNEEKAKRIEELGIRSSRNRIQKYKLWDESQERCFYCGQPVGVKEFLSGFDVEVEHIIPKSLFFDDSFNNKVCSCRKCNAEKNNRTAFDYMASKGETTLNEYINRVEQYYKEGKISKIKRERLLTPASKIPTDFIDRQLRQSQYIAKKSQEILKQVCRNVWSTSGSVTDFLRHSWGYDNILHSLNFERYKKGGLTEKINYDHKEQEHTEERIKDWSKRLDHRHHAIDALTIACTQQGYIQRLNNLNTERDAMFQEVEQQSVEWQERKSLLEKWITLQPHFSVEEVTNKVAEILISFKAGKRVATIGKHIVYKKGKKVIAQEGIIIPRGALSEEFVYGKINVIEKNKPVKYLFENPHLIFKPYIKNLVEARIAQYNGDGKKALQSIKKEPIYLDANKSIMLEYATCFKSEYVIKYPLISLKLKDTDAIIDKHIKEIIINRLNECNNDPKKAFSTPLYADKNCTIPIHTVRCSTGLSAVAPVKYDSSNEPTGFVKPGNNHHIAIYTDAEGKKQEHVVTFWHAVERKKYGIPVIIENPSEVWDAIMDKDLPESFLNALPDATWTFDISMQQNEMFVLGMNEEEWDDAIQTKDYKILCKHLYKVQSLSNSQYLFTLNTITSPFNQYDANNEDKRFIRSKSISSLFALHPHKVRISLLGDILL